MKYFITISTIIILPNAVIVNDRMRPPEKSYPLPWCLTEGDRAHLILLRWNWRAAPLLYLISPAVTGPTRTVRSFCWASAELTNARHSLRTRPGGFRRTKNVAVMVHGRNLDQVHKFVKENGIGEHEVHSSTVIPTHDDAPPFCYHGVFSCMAASFYHILHNYVKEVRYGTDPVREGSQEAAD